jgi:hypothetical protein
MLNQFVRRLFKEGKFDDNIKMEGRELVFLKLH